MERRHRSLPRVGSHREPGSPDGSRDQRPGKIKKAIVRTTAFAAPLGMLGGGITAAIRTDASTTPPRAGITTLDNSHQTSCPIPDIVVTTTDRQVTARVQTQAPVEATLVAATTLDRAAITPPTTSTEKVRVKSGDTIWAIGKRLLRQGKIKNPTVAQENRVMHEIIADSEAANELKNPNVIQIGETLTAPTPADAVALDNISKIKPSSSVPADVEAAVKDLQGADNYAAGTTDTSTIVQKNDKKMDTDIAVLENSVVNSPGGTDATYLVGGNNTTLTAHRTDASQGQTDIATTDVITAVPQQFTPEPVISNSPRLEGIQTTDQLLTTNATAEGTAVVSNDLTAREYATLLTNAVAIFKGVNAKQFEADLSTAETAGIVNSSATLGKKASSVSNSVEIGQEKFGPTFLNSRDNVITHVTQGLNSPTYKFTEMGPDTKYIGLNQVSQDLIGAIGFLSQDDLKKLNGNIPDQAYALIKQLVGLNYRSSDLTYKEIFESDHAAAANVLTVLNAIGADTLTQYAPDIQKILKNPSTAQAALEKLFNETDITSSLTSLVFGRSRNGVTVLVSDSVNQGNFATAA